MSKCTEPCGVKLKCGHHCSGTCGDCLQGRFHVRCNEECGVPLICTHTCPIPCRQNCRPCQKQCLYNCGHSTCKKPCGVPCTPCGEPCNRKCSHQKCVKKCGDICSVGPCSERCTKKRKECDHPCIGFCGDICPKLCRICDKEKLTEIFFGTEEEEDAIFVMLENCDHIFESSGLDEWMNVDDGEIKAKVCPRCKTTITRSRRYNEILKKNMDDLANVKRMAIGNYYENKTKRIVLEDRIANIFSELKRWVQGTRK